MTRLLANYTDPFRKNRHYRTACEQCGKVASHWVRCTADIEHKHHQWCESCFSGSEDPCAIAARKNAPG